MSVDSLRKFAAGQCNGKGKEKEERREGKGRSSQSFSVETLLACSNTRPSAEVERVPMPHFLPPGGGPAGPCGGQSTEDALDSTLHNQLLGHSRRTFTDTQTYMLEKSFQYWPYVRAAERRTLSLLTGLKDQQIKVWFQNRRAKERREMVFYSRHRTHHGLLLATLPAHSSWWRLTNGATPFTPYPPSLAYGVCTPPLSSEALQVLPVLLPSPDNSAHTTEPPRPDPLSPAADMQRE